MVPPDSPELELGPRPEVISLLTSDEDEDDDVYTTASSSPPPPPPPERSGPLQAHKAAPERKVPLPLMRWAVIPAPAARPSLTPRLTQAESAQSGGIVLDDSNDEADSAAELPAAASANDSTIDDGPGDDGGASVAPGPVVQARTQSAAKMTRNTGPAAFKHVTYQYQHPHQQVTPPLAPPRMNSKRRRASDGHHARHERTVCPKRVEHFGTIGLVDASDAAEHRQHGAPALSAPLAPRAASHNDNRVRGVKVEPVDGSYDCQICMESVRSPAGRTL